jgi:hypothetical protein
MYPQQLIKITGWCVKLEFGDGHAEYDILAWAEHPFSAKDRGNDLRMLAEGTRARRRWLNEGG